MNKDKRTIAYDEMDMEIINALIKGMKQYEKDAHQRSEDIKRDTLLVTPEKKLSRKIFMKPRK